MTRFPVLRAELRKVLTLRSVVGLVVGGPLLLAVTGVMQASALAAGRPAPHPSTYPVDAVLSVVLFGLPIAAAAIGVAGAIAVGGEFATGSATSTFVAVPRRSRVVVAKAAALALVAGLVMVPAVLATVTIASDRLAPLGLDVRFSDGSVLRVLAAAVWYAVVLGWLGQALAWLTRSATAAVVLLVSVMAATLLGGLALPRAAQDAILPYLPTEAASAALRIVPLPGRLDPWVGWVVLAAWAVALLLVAVGAVRRRDV